MIGIGTRRRRRKKIDACMPPDVTNSAPTIYYNTIQHKNSTLSMSSTEGHNVGIVYINERGGEEHVTRGLVNAKLGIDERSGEMDRMVANYTHSLLGLVVFHNKTVEERDTYLDGVVNAVPDHMSDMKKNVRDLVARIRVVLH